MSNKLAELQALANQEVLESGIDMNEAVKGGSGRLLPEGYAFGRLVEYIEYGNQPQEFGGKAKEPALEFSIGFALWGQGYQNDDGTPYIVRTYSTAMSRNEKSRAFKLFKALNWKGTAKGYAQLLGEAFLVKIKHVAKSKADTQIVSRIDLDGFLPPLDPVSKQAYPIPAAADELYRMFLWNRPTKAAWDSLYVEGTYDAKDGKPAQSKNRLQETILAALDFQGSPLQQLLLNAGVTTLPAAAPALPAAPAVAAAPAAVAVAPVVAAPLVAAPVAAAPAVAPAVLSAPAVVATPPALTVAALPVVAPTVSPAPIAPSAPVLAPVVAAPALPVLPA